jgi:hypothetical protein
MKLKQKKLKKKLPLEQQLQPNITNPDKIPKAKHYIN